MEEGKAWFATPLLPNHGPVTTEIVENGIKYTVDVENGQKTVSFFSVLIEKPTFVTSKCLWNQYFELTRQFTDVNKGAESKS